MGERLTAGEVCMRDVVIAQRDTPILEAAQLMRGQHVGCLVVVEEDGMQRPVCGLLTDRDLVIGVGGYHAAFRHCEDLDLWLRWMNAGLHFANLPQVLVQYRQNNTRRDQRHWRFNLRARISNFSGQYLVRRTIGIACIAMWVVMPKIAQEQIFKTLILRRR